MAKPCVLSKEARAYIADNCTMSGEDIKPLIKEKFGVDVSVQAIIAHLRAARQNAEVATRTADAFIARTISDRVATYAPKILDRYEKELERIERILDGTDTEFLLKQDDQDGRDKFWATRYTKLYTEIAQQYLALRPPIQTVRIDSVVDPEIAIMDTWSDEKLIEYEKFLKKLNEME